MGQRLRIILSREKAIELGWDGLGLAGLAVGYTKKNARFPSDLDEPDVPDSYVCSGSREA